MIIEGALKRVIYTSRVRGALSDADRTAIYAASKRNNGMDGITGILWVENRRILQLVEGPQESVDLALSRIRADARNDGVTVLEESIQRDRVFPDWAMAGLPG